MKISVTYICYLDHPSQKCFIGVFNCQIPHLLTLGWNISCSSWFHIPFVAHLRHLILFLWIHLICSCWDVSSCFSYLSEEVSILRMGVVVEHPKSAWAIHVLIRCLLVDLLGRLFFRGVCFYLCSGINQQIIDLSWLRQHELAVICLRLVKSTWLFRFNQWLVWYRSELDITGSFNASHLGLAFAIHQLPWTLFLQLHHRLHLKRTRHLFCPCLIMINDFRLSRIKLLHHDPSLLIARPHDRTIPVSPSLSRPAVDNMA